MATEAGNQLKDLVGYTAEMAENVARLLRNGLTFNDNFSCDVREVSAKHNEETVISGSKPVVGVIPVRVLSTSIGLDSFAWWYDERGRLTIKAGFTSAPTAAQKMTIVLLF